MVRDIFLLRFYIYIYIYLVGKKIYLVLEDYFKTQTLSIETKTNRCTFGNEKVHPRTGKLFESASRYASNTEKSEKVIRN